jgi:ornithine cyclodeaminase
MLGARYLARANSKNILIIGSGTVARSLIEAYSAMYPDLELISIASRKPENAVSLSSEMAAKGYKVTAVSDTAQAARSADIISTATLSTAPILKGEWISPGTHVDLIGAFRPDMREADDAVMSKGKLFVDSRQTTIDHIGELIMPIQDGVISQQDVLGDFYDLCNGSIGRTSENDITVFKNGGGAHLDTMTAHLIWSRYVSERSES